MLQVLIICASTKKYEYFIPCTKVCCEYWMLIIRNKLFVQEIKYSYFLVEKKTKKKNNLS